MIEFYSENNFELDHQVAVAQWIMSIIEANGDTFEGDDDPPAYWWVPAAFFIARCAEVSVSYDSDGNWSISAGWDC